MSQPHPTSRRRRIAGERKPVRRTDPAGPTGPTGPTDPTGPAGGPYGPVGSGGAIEQRSDRTFQDAPGESPEENSDETTDETIDGTIGQRVPRRPLRLRTIAVLAVAALVLVAAAAWLGLGTWDVRTVRQADARDQVAQVVPAVAERAATTILSYDYKALDHDESAAGRFMTPAYRKTYRHTFDTLVRPNATKLEARVQADVKASGVTEADAGRASVLVFVNQTTRSTAHAQPQVALNRVAMTLVKQQGSWLVSKITSY